MTNVTDRDSGIVETLKNLITEINLIRADLVALRTEYDGHVHGGVTVGGVNTSGAATPPALTSAPITMVPS